MKTDVQVITTKYSTANSTYDTIIKLLSSTITALFDSAKDYLRFWLSNTHNYRPLSGPEKWDQRFILLSITFHSFFITILQNERFW